MCGVSLQQPRPENGTTLSLPAAHAGLKHYDYTVVEVKKRSLKSRIRGVDTADLTKPKPSLFLGRS